MDPTPGRYVVGAMPLVVPVLERLDVAGIVDRACPMRGRAHLTHGEVIAALVANRLTAPRPLYDVAGWANTYATNDWLGTPGALLNDDRLGRALDAMAGRIDEIASAVALAAIGAFGIDAARLHWDFTSVAFCGAYDDQDPASPTIGYGHSSDRKGHRRQLKVAHATTASGIPLFGRVVDGARHEGAETGELLESLRGLAEPRRLLFVADSALVNKANLAAADTAGIRFVSRLPRTFDYESDALAQPEEAWQTLTYCAHAPSGWHRLSGPASGERSRPSTWSGRTRSPGASGSSTSMAPRRPPPPEPAGPGCCPTPKTPSPHRARTGHQAPPRPRTRRAPGGQAVADGRVGQWLRTEVNEDEHGNLSLRWWRDPAALAEAKRRDGLYALVTNMTPPMLGQPAPRPLQRPGALRTSPPLPQRTTGRSTGVPALQPPSRRPGRRLLHRPARLRTHRDRNPQAISPARTIEGLLPERRAARPTAENIFRAFAGLGFQRVRTTTGLEAIADPLTPAQQAILDALQITTIVPPKGLNIPQTVRNTGLDDSRAFSSATTDTQVACSRFDAGLTVGAHWAKPSDDLRAATGCSRGSKGARAILPVGAVRVDMVISKGLRARLSLFPTVRFPPPRPKDAHMCLSERCWHHLPNLRPSPFAPSPLASICVFR